LDAVWLEWRVAVEVHGGVHAGGRHTRGQGFINDREKMNEAQLLGWIVLEMPIQWLENDPLWCITMIAEAMMVQGVRKLQAAGIEVR